jgi:hypothetical protein
MLFTFSLPIPIATRGGDDRRRVGVGFGVGVGSGDDLEGRTDAPPLSSLPSSRGMAPRRGGGGDDVLRIEEGDGRPDPRRRCSPAVVREPAPRVNCAVRLGSPRRAPRGDRAGGGGVCAAADHRRRPIAEGSGSPRAAETGVDDRDDGDSHDVNGRDEGACA